MIRWDLSDLVWLIDELMISTADFRMTHAPLIWNFLSYSLEVVLTSMEERVAAVQPLPVVRDPEIAREVTCGVCLVNLPNVAIVACGHVLCTTCGTRIFRCPFCYGPVGRLLHIYYS